MEAQNKGIEFSKEQKSKIPIHNPIVYTKPILETQRRLSEQLTSKSLALVKLSFEFHSREITSSKAKIFLKTLNNARSILKTHLKKNFLTPEKSSSIPKMEIKLVVDFLSQIRDVKLELEEKFASETKTLMNEIAHRDALILQKDREILDLKEKFADKNKEAEFWKKKFADSLTRPCNDFESNSEATSLYASYDWETYGPFPEIGFFYGDICSSPPFKTNEISLIELRINDYKNLKNEVKKTENIANYPNEVNNTIIPLKISSHDDTSLTGQTYSDTKPLEIPEEETFGGSENHCVGGERKPKNLKKRKKKKY